MIVSPDPTDKEQHVTDTKTIMCKTDINGFIEYANEYFVELSEYNEGEIMGESLDLIAHPDMPKVITKYVWEKIKQKQKVFAIIKYLSKSGSYYWLEVKFDFKVSELTREILNIYLYATTPLRKSVLEIDKFYSILNKIEKESGPEVANNYFNGYLENEGENYEDFIEKYLKQ